MTTHSPEEKAVLVVCDFRSEAEPHHELEPHTKDNDCVNDRLWDETSTDTEPIIVSKGQRIQLTDEDGNPIDVGAARKAAIKVGESALDVGISAVGEAAGKIVSRFKNAFESFADKLEGREPEPDLRETVATQDEEPKEKDAS